MADVIDRAQAMTELQMSAKRLIVAYEANAEGRVVFYEVEKQSTTEGSYGYMDTKSILDMIDDAPTIEPETDCISRQAAIDSFKLDDDGSQWSMEDIVYRLEQFPSVDEMPSVQPEQPPEWNVHTIACILADIFGDTCACNYNGIDEWLPEKCEYNMTSCPDPGGVACWEQFVKHRKGKA